MYAFRRFLGGGGESAHLRPWNASMPMVLTSSYVRPELTRREEVLGKIEDMPTSCLFLAGPLDGVQRGANLSLLLN